MKIPRIALRALLFRSYSQGVTGHGLDHKWSRLNKLIKDITSNWNIFIVNFFTLTTISYEPI